MRKLRASRARSYSCNCTSHSAVVHCRVQCMQFASSANERVASFPLKKMCILSRSRKRGRKRESLGFSCKKDSTNCKIIIGVAFEGRCLFVYRVSLRIISRRTGTTDESVNTFAGSKNFIVLQRITISLKNCQIFISHILPECSEYRILIAMYNEYSYSIHVRECVKKSGS